MGILGTMTVNFAANIDGLKQSRIDHSISLKATKAALGIKSEKPSAIDKKSKRLTIEQVAREVAIQFYEKRKDKHAT